jgi:ABC-2 type transport system permease protein
MQVVITSVKREFWEFNNILKWVPIVTAALVILMPIFVFMQSNDTLSEIFQTLAMFPENFVSSEYTEMVPKLFFVTSLSLFAPFVAVAVIIQLYYFTVCMFDERRDMSVMFWRSLPVSDMVTIVSKLITGALVIPAVFLGAATATLLFFLTIGFLTCIILSVGYDASLWALWIDSDIISGLALIWLHLLPYAVWMLPLFAWLMLASMFAKKAPFLWAILPIAVVLLVEGFVVQYFNLSQPFIGSLLMDYFSISKEFVLSIQGQDNFSRTIPLQALMSKLDVTSVIAATALLYGTYWLRMNKGEV